MKFKELMELLNLWNFIFNVIFLSMEFSLWKSLKSIIICKVYVKSIEFLKYICPVIYVSRIYVFQGVLRIRFNFTGSGSADPVEKSDPDL